MITQASLLCRFFAITGIVALAPSVPAQTAGAFAPTGKMIEARSLAKAIPLLDGKVLIIGGLGPGSVCACTPLASAEIYDPLAGKFTATGSMSAPRYGFSAILLKDGTVLVAGGDRDISAEIYDPARGTFRRTGDMVTSRYLGTATLLDNGKVLIMGGTTFDKPNPPAPAEVYDTATGKFSGLAILGSSPYPIATVLPDGRILLAGPDTSQTTSTTEIFNPSSVTLSQTGRFANYPGYLDAFSATPLTSGEILFAGGTDDDNYFNDMVLAQIYDPASAAFGFAGQMKQGRQAHSATLLPGGKVLIAGGFANLPTIVIGAYSANYVDRTLAAAEVYDPSTRSFVGVGDMTTPREGHAAVPLADGTVLVAGGESMDYYTDQRYVTHPLDSAELYFPVPVAVSSAGLTAPLAPESLASLFGPRLAKITAAADVRSLPEKLSGIQVRVRDSTGVERLSPLLYVSPSQINFEVPPGTAPGYSTVDILDGDAPPISVVARVASLAPGLFTLPANAAAAYGLRMEPDGSQTFLPAGSPIVLDSRPTYLILFGTGIRNRSSLSNVKCTIEGKDALVTYAGPSGVPGLDQVNILLPSTNVKSISHLRLTVDGIAANTVLVDVR